MSEDLTRWEERHHLTTCLVMWTGDSEWKVSYELGYFIAKHPVEQGPDPERSKDKAERNWHEWFRCRKQ